MFSRLLSILSRFFWGEGHGKAKRKWLALSKLCKPTMEGGIGVRDFSEVQKAKHMKFAWRLLPMDNLWTRFFKAKYFRNRHVMEVYAKASYSRFWKSMVRVMPEVLENMHVWVREGNASFGFDKWLSWGPLAIDMSDIYFPQLQVNDCWVDSSWDRGFLEELVGATKMREIISELPALREGMT